MHGARMALLPHPRPPRRALRRLCPPRVWEVCTADNGRISLAEQHWRYKEEATQLLLGCRDGNHSLEAQPRVLMLLRSSAQRVWATQSTDGGQTWEHVHQMFDLPNPDAKVSVIRLSPGGKE